MDKGIGTPTAPSATCDHVYHLHNEQEVVNTETPNPQTPKASDYLAGNVRPDSELYCDFKCRLHWEKKLLKQYLHGRSVWVGRDRGEARNPERRLRDSKTKIRKNAYNERVRKYQESMGIRTIKELNTTKRIKKELLEAKHASN